MTIAVEGDQRPRPAAVDEVAYRILQESLTNVLPPCRAGGAGDGVPAGSGPGARPRAESGAPPGLATLTDREREVVALVAAGTVERRDRGAAGGQPADRQDPVSRAMTKLAAMDRAQLVVLAYAHGLATPSR